jgi:hypothetical protein
MFLDALCEYQILNYNYLITFTLTLSHQGMNRMVHIKGEDIHYPSLPRREGIKGRVTQKIKIPFVAYSKY